MSAFFGYGCTKTTTRQLSGLAFCLSGTFVYLSITLNKPRSEIPRQARPAS